MKKGSAARRRLAERCKLQKTLQRLIQLIHFPGFHGTVLNQTEAKQKGGELVF